MDILGALEANPTRGTRRCRIGQFLDDIPADTPGRDELIRLVETRHGQGGGEETRSGQTMALILTKLGLETTPNPIHAHRNGACACYR